MFNFKSYTTIGITAAIFIFIQCKHKENSVKFPTPTDTVIKLDAEDMPKKAAREAWIESMHTAGQENVNWRAIEYQNNKQTAIHKSNLRKQGHANHRNNETIVDGKLTGTWKERGSNNQAGSILVTKYDPKSDLIYCVSAGGTLWKGGRDGFSWEVVNQDYVFSNYYLDIFHRNDGTIRLVAAINGRPHFSDDDGATWESAIFPNTSSGWQLYDYTKLDEDMFVLFKSNWNGNIHLLRSTDLGESWIIAKSFTNGDSRNFTINNPTGTDKLYLMEQISENKSKIYSWNKESMTLDIYLDSSNIGFGENKRANLKGIFVDSIINLYTIDKDNQLQESQDTGKTWTYISEAPKTMWRVGFEIIPTAPSKIFMGEVEAWKTRTDTSIWTKVNNWFDYYPDIVTNLHADIMDIESYITSDSTPFLLMSNHGGISISYDEGEHFLNIGLIGLNVSQYYSVRTHPTQQDLVFAGSQDQGFQRGSIDSDGTASFNQVISGDYGHIVFTGHDNMLWTVYPFGAISYYEEPKTQSVTDWYSLENPTNSVWIPPLLANPDRDINGIYVAGGNLYDNSGSHMIRIDRVNGQFITSQFDQDFSINGGGAITAMAFNHFDNDIIYVATQYGNIFTSNDAGSTFTQVQNSTVEGHYLYGSCLYPSKLDPNIVFLSGSGYTGASVLKSTDGGLSYHPMSEGLPPTLVFAIEPNEDESLIFAATEAGPYVYISEDQSWYPLSGLSAPSTGYWSVEYLPETKTARFGTYGRGIWDFEIEELILDVKSKESRIDVNIYPNPASENITIDLNGQYQTEIKIINTKGVLIKSEIINETATIDISDFAMGSYYIYFIVNESPVVKSFVKW